MWFLEEEEKIKIDASASISKVLDNKKFKDNCDVDIHIERAYCIQC